LSAPHRATFALRPGLHLGIDSTRSSRGDAPLDLNIAFRRVQEPTLHGGHKTVNWRIELGSPEEPSLNAAIELRGAPRSFGLSLVQGYFVEPLLSLAAAREGSVLLPCAAIATDEGLLLLLGRSSWATIRRLSTRRDGARPSRDG
jgi:hypothetical protein